MSTRVQEEASKIQKKVDKIIERYNSEEKALISILQDIQTEYNYLPKEALLRVRDKVGVPLTSIYAVATFYNAFSLKPRGRHIILVCMGTACHVKGAGKILERLEQKLGIKTGGVTKDLRFSLGGVRCLGCCSLAPVVKIDEDTYGRVRQDELMEILNRYE